MSTENTEQQHVKTRNDLDPQQQWQLEDLYPDRTAWDNDFAKVKEKIQDFSLFRGKLHAPEQVKACFERQDEISLLTERLYVYANMKHHEDMSIADYQALSDKISKLAVDVNEAMSFVMPEMISLPEDTLKGFLDHPALTFYRHTLDEMLREKAHVLSMAEEALLAQVGQISRTPGTVFGMLNNADLKFPPVRDEFGDEQPLTHGTYIQFLESRDRRVRQEAFTSVYSTYRKQKNTIAALLNGNVTKNAFYAKVRKYPSALEMSLDTDNISTEVYTNLLDTIHEHLPLLQRYIALRRNLLKLDEVHMYDLFTPLVEEFDWQINYEDAKAYVEKSLAPLGEDYLKALREGFDNGWIDVYENEGKKSGAYSWGAYGTHPYVLLNHNDNLNSAFTLTHEMGHALHTHFADESQPYRYAQYTIFLAEVASTLNESLLMDYLLKNTDDPKAKIYLLTYYADQFRTTVFRQTMFAEFEKIIHEQVEAGESLTPEALSKIYYDLNVQYHGEQMTVDQDIEMEWARIPHFYNSFYVYKYATGFSAATSFAKQIIDEGQPAVDRYLAFLKSGGSDYSLDILKKAGVDMTTPDPIRQALSVFEGLIVEMEALVSKIES